MISPEFREARTMEVPVKTVFTPALLAATLLLGVVPAMADPPICIDTRDITSEKVEGHGVSILYKMRDGTQWRNTLKGPCPDLDFYGYVWTVRNPDNSVCENENSMRVLQSGEICILGKFTKVTPPLTRPRTPG
jgi:hypothetical protein